MYASERTVNKEGKFAERFDSVESRSLHDAPPPTDPGSSAFGSTLRQHGIFIERNLEVGVQGGQIFAANHYLANVCGLACLGLSYPAIPEANRCRMAGLGS